ncbi:MAG TPA: phosphatase PAP2 family protein [Gaiellaceae bacterium]|nr:phosphatase PAP2 family protein [Gaiellaceae bacterium]
MDGRESRARTFSGRREVAIGLGMYAIYLLVRTAVVNDNGRSQARRNAERIVAAEQRLGIHFESELQRVLLPRTRLIAFLNVAYAVANVGLTVGWLVRLFFRRRPEFHRLRRAAVLTTLGAQPVFLLFPTAPPRTLDHLVDTIAEVSGFDLDSGLIAKLYDPIAAMPSIHVAYAVVTATGIAETSRSPFVRRVAPAYSPLVALTVLATANHYVLDCVAGAALGFTGLRFARELER